MGVRSSIGMVMSMCMIMMMVMMMMVVHMTRNKTTGHKKISNIILLLLLWG